MSTSPPSSPDPSVPLTPTDRSKLRRLQKQGSYERALIYEILAAGLVCHVGFVADGQPYAIPTAYARLGDQLYVHGSPVSRLMRSLNSGIEVCITVTLLDGLVLARSAFHHSMNYRSVVVFGTATAIADPTEKMAAMQALTEHIVPGRWAEARQPTAQELNATMVLALPLVEASAKCRTGPPKDEPDDYALPIWAGELPLRWAAGAPIADSTEVPLPGYVSHYSRSKTDQTRSAVD